MPAATSNQTQEFLEALVINLEDTDGRFVIAGFAETRRPEIWHSTPSTASESLPAALRVNEGEATNIYWGAALMRGDLPPNKRGGKDDIMAMIAIVIDLDDPEAAARYESGIRPGGFEPSIVIRTSNTPSPRYQLVFLLNEPETDIDTWRKAALALEDAYGADQCSKDAAHVWRMPGTINHPNQKKRDSGRISEPAEIILFKPSRRFEARDFNDMLMACTVEHSGSPAPIDHTTSQTWESIDDILGWLPEKTRKRILDGSLLPDRSAFDFLVCCQAVEAGLLLGDVLQLYSWGERETLSFASKFAERSDGVGYLRRTFERAITEASVPSLRRDTPVAPAAHANDNKKATEPTALARRQTIYSRAELRAMPAPSWLIERLMPKGCLSVMYGAPGTAKSFAALSLALHVATGLPWHGREVVKGGILYIAGEGATGLEARIEAWERHHDSVGEDMPFFWVRTEPVDLLNAPDGSNFRDFLAELDKTVPHNADNPVLIIIDTLARNFGDGDENVQRDMNQFVNACDTLRAKYGCAVLVVHHSGKDESSGARGSSVLRAALDTELRIKKTASGLVTMKVTKQKDAEDGDELFFELVPVELSHRETDESSCVLVQQSSSARPDAQAILEREAICNALTVSPKPLIRARLADACREAGSTSESQVQKAINQLIDEGVVVREDKLFRLVPEPEVTPMLVA